MYHLTPLRSASILRIIFCLLVSLALFASIAAAQAPSGYYDDANGKTGNDLRIALHNIIDNHTTIPFNSTSYDTHDALDDLDEDPNDPSKVILLYSGWSMAKSLWPEYNREHTWPKSYGTDHAPAETDMHAVFACDMNVNSSRGNKYYDEGGTSYHPEAPESFYDFDSWEPRDEDKGDMARVMFYMDVRYSGDAPYELDLELTDNTNLILSGSRYMGKLSTLIKWHAEDPVDDRERIRNNFIYDNIQHNRNPFVDNPSWVYCLWGGALTVDTFTLSAGVGGTAEFALDAGAGQAGRCYFLLGGASGGEPGLPLPGGMCTLPLNWDSLTDIIISLANSPALVNFHGVLNGQGACSAQLNTYGSLPPTSVGVVMRFAYLLYYPAVYYPYDYVSNAVGMEIVP